MATAVKDLLDREREARWQREFSEDVHDAAWLAMAIGAVTLVVDLIAWPPAARASEKPDLFLVLWPAAQWLVTYGGHAAAIAALKVLGIGTLAVAAVWTDGFDRGPANLEVAIGIGAVALILGAVPIAVALVVVVLNVALWVAIGIAILVVSLMLLAAFAGLYDQ